jgi:hypothetical protein
LTLYIKGTKGTKGTYGSLMIPPFYFLHLFLKRKRKDQKEKGRIKRKKEGSKGKRKDQKENLVSFKDQKENLVSFKDQKKKGRIKRKPWFPFL